MRIPDDDSETDPKVLFMMNIHSSSRGKSVDEIVRWADKHIEEAIHGLVVDYKREGWEMGSIEGAVAPIRVLLTEAKNDYLTLKEAGVPSWSIEVDLFRKIPEYARIEPIFKQVVCEAESRTSDLGTIAAYVERRFGSLLGSMLKEHETRPKQPETANLSDWAVQVSQFVGSLKAEYLAGRNGVKKEPEPAS